MPLTPPMEIAAWLACLAFLIFLVNGALKLVDRMKDKPSPGQVQGEAHQTFATKVELTKATTDFNAEITRLYDKREDDLRLAAQSRKAMHEDIQGISTQVAALQSTTTSQTQQLQRMDQKIDNMPERVITTLRNTGAIGP